MKGNEKETVLLLGICRELMYCQRIDLYQLFLAAVHLLASNLVHLCAITSGELTEFGDLFGDP